MKPLRLTRAGGSRHPSGMTGVGGGCEITPQILLRAYAIGMFPMAESADDPTLFWVDPQIRGIFPLDGLMVSKRLARAVRSDRYEVRIDRDFDGVISGCAASATDRPDTWINVRIRRLYRDLFDLGHVHTVECYAQGALVGGLYGVSIGAAFFGESMFHRAPDASKVALVHLVARAEGGRFPPAGRTIRDAASRDPRRRRNLARTLSRDAGRRAWTFRRLLYLEQGRAGRRKNGAGGACFSERGRAGIRLRPVRGRRTMFGRRQQGRVCGFEGAARTGHRDVATQSQNVVEMTGRFW